MPLFISTPIQKSKGTGVELFLVIRDIIDSGVLPLNSAFMEQIEVTMFIAMNRFKIKPGHEQEFVDVWKGRDSHLHTVPGFMEFHLLQGPGNDDFTLFSSHAKWESRDAFEAWTKSEAFRKAHASAGSRKDIYMGPPQLECFEVVL